MKKIISICVIVSFLLIGFTNIINTNAFSEPVVKNSDEGDRYAVITVGRYFGIINFDPKAWGQPYWPNLKHVQTYYSYYLHDSAVFYNMLVNDFGYNPDNIYFLVKTLPEGIKVKTNQTESGYYTFFEKPNEFNSIPKDRLFDSDEDTLVNILNNLGQKMDSDDSLLFTFIGHGGTNSEGTFFGCPLQNINDGIQYLIWLLSTFDIGGLEESIKLFGVSDPCRLYDHEMGNYVDNMNTDAKITFLLQPCHSGGFIKELSGENRIICTSSNIGEIADDWINPFRSALQGNLEADYNNDGKVSINEAFKASAVYIDNHPIYEGYSPMIDDNGDGEGHNITESGYFDPENPPITNNPELFDGWLANFTFLLDDPYPLHVDAGGPYSFSLNEDVEFDATADGGKKSYTWQWDFDITIDSDEDGIPDNDIDSAKEDPTYKYTEIGTYNAKVTVIDQNLDAVSDTTEIVITKSRNRGKLFTKLFEIIPNLIHFLKIINMLKLP